MRAGCPRSRREEIGLSEQRTINGAQWLARALAETGMTHVFFVESCMRRTLMEFEDLGVTRILAHSEKAAAYIWQTVTPASPGNRECAWRSRSAPPISPPDYRA